AREVHGEVRELHAEEQIAAELPDRQLAVEVLFRLADDVAAEPVLEPGCLRHDQRHRRDAHDQGAGEGNDLEQTSGGAHQNACPMLKCTRKWRGSGSPSTSSPSRGFNWMPRSTRSGPI